MLLYRINQKKHRVNGLLFQIMGLKVGWVPLFLAILAIFGHFGHFGDFGRNLGVLYVIYRTLIPGLSEEQTPGLAV